MLDQINIIQLNVNHCAAAQTLLAQTARERNADVVLLSEPYLPEVGSSGMLFDELGKVSIKCRTSLAMEEREIEPMRGFAYAKIKGELLQLYSSYDPPSDSPEQFEDQESSKEPISFEGNEDGGCPQWPC